LRFGNADSSFSFLIGAKIAQDFFNASEGKNPLFFLLWITLFATRARIEDNKKEGNFDIRSSPEGVQVHQRSKGEIF
jgi:hypothetical protein